MHWQGIKIHVVVVSIILALAAFFAAHWLYDNLNYREPLKKKLQANELVTGYELSDDESGVFRVSVSIKETDNLMLSYQQVFESVQLVLGNRDFTLELVDRRDDLLTDVYNQGQFAIQEALVRGNFRDMAGTLNEIARRSGAESTVYIDDSNIYWQMRHGEYYLYQVIPRPLLPGPVPGDAAAGRR